jgi:hypothetical protein
MEDLRGRHCAGARLPTCTEADPSLALDWMTALAPFPSRLGLLKTKAREKGASKMKIIGCDFHPSFQQIAMLDESTGELMGRRLSHPAEAEAFYRSLKGPVRVGMEAIGNTQWFERLLAELGHELWIGDAARIRAMVVRQQDRCAGCRSLVGTDVA